MRTLFTLGSIYNANASGSEQQLKQKRNENTNFHKVNQLAI